MDVRRITFGDVVLHKTEVVIAMWKLRRAAWIDDVDLRRDLVIGTEPGLRCECDDVIRVVVSEYVWISLSELLQGVPDAIVGTGLGEVVAAGGGG